MTGSVRAFSGITISIVSLMIIFYSIEIVAVIWGIYGILFLIVFIIKRMNEKKKLILKYKF